MAAQTLSEIEFYQWMNESLVKLESQLQTLCNEFRSIRTSLETPQTHISLPPKPATLLVTPQRNPSPPSQFQTMLSPLPPLIVASIPSTKTTSTSLEPSLKRSVSLPQIATAPKRTGTDIISHMFHKFHKFSLSFNYLNHPCWFKPISRNFGRPQLYPKATVNIFGSYGSGASNESQDPRYGFDGVHAPIEEANGKREWRPPWLATTSPNATGRTEWRPPWVIPENGPDFILEDKDDLRRVD
ncbi:hypothetical protein HanIR_Chr13g0645081 [Helianthus annuus]|nr:hypothetical protein HanIR_Chr13g0645081 [Helianthus annuus]